MKKSAKKIKEQLEFWLLKYYIKERIDLNGKEPFTIFDLMDDKLKAKLTKKLNLRENEFPALSLKVSVDGYIINTTERFIRLTENKVEQIEYTNFESHVGYGISMNNRSLKGQSINVKTEGHYSKFGIMTKTGEKIEWTIPTGIPGFGFWNVTKKCELIGRKYLK